MKNKKAIFLYLQYIYFSSQSKEICEYQIPMSTGEHIPSCYLLCLLFVQSWQLVVENRYKQTEVTMAHIHNIIRASFPINNIDLSRRFQTAKIELGRIPHQTVKYIILFSASNEFRSSTLTQLQNSADGFLVFRRRWRNVF